MTFYCLNSVPDLQFLLGTDPSQFYHMETCSQSLQGEQIHYINKTLNRNKLTNNENWCDIKQYDVKDFKLSIFYLMTCVNCLNFYNNYSDNNYIQSHTHCVHDTFSHIHTVYMTYLGTSTLYM